MGGARIPVWVADDVSVLKQALVHRPVSHHPDAVGMYTDRAAAAQAQHDHLVAELERAGIAVHRLDQLLQSALEYADARDWLVERRIRECDIDRRGAMEIGGWLSEQPAPTLASYLIDGLQVCAMPRLFQQFGDSTDNPGGWLLPPLVQLGYPQKLVRFLGSGALISQPGPAITRAEAINISAVLNFAPLFDEARFDFWITSDAADHTIPPIQGVDIARLNGAVAVGAITHATSIQALSLLAVALFRGNGARVMYWLDLTGAGCSSLDQCLVPLGRNRLLVDSAVLSRASAFAVRPDRGDGMLDIVPCATGLLDCLRPSRRGRSGDPRQSPTSSFEPAVVIDAAAHPGPVGRALSELAPIVIGPGRVMVFKQQEPALAILEEHGVNVVSVLDGSALSRGGRGPRALATALLAEPAGA